MEKKEVYICQQQPNFEEDEIDLRELFKTIWNYKKFIVIFTLFFTIISVLYVFTLKEKSFFQGELFVELPQIKTENRIIPVIDIVDLKFIIQQKFNSITIESPKRSKVIIFLIYNDKNKEVIKSKLMKSFDYIKQLTRDKLEELNINNYIKLKQLRNMTISKKIIKPKKRLIVIVTFITSFILTIFLVFFIEFIKSTKEEEK